MQDLKEIKQFQKCNKVTKVASQTDKIIPCWKQDSINLVDHTVQSSDVCGRHSQRGGVHCAASAFANKEWKVAKPKL